MDLQANPSSSQVRAHVLVQTEHKKKEQDNIPGVSTLDLALLAIFDCVQIGHKTDAIQVEGLQANAALQNNLINQMAKQQTSTLSQTQMVKKVAIYKTEYCGSHGNVIKHVLVGYKMEKQAISAAVLDQLQWKNQLSTEVRGVIEAKLNLQGQNAQVISSGISCTTDSVQQTHQEFTALLSNLTQLSNQTARM